MLQAAAYGSGVDLVDEDLQKTYDGDWRLRPCDRQEITVIDGNRHNGVAAGDHTAADIQRIPGAGNDLERVYTCVEAILSGYPSFRRLMDKALDRGGSVAGCDTWVLAEVHLIRIRSQAGVRHATLVSRGLVASCHRLLVGICAVCATWHRRGGSGRQPRNILQTTPRDDCGRVTEMRRDLHAVASSSEAAVGHQIEGLADHAASTREDARILNRPVLVLYEGQAVGCAIGRIVWMARVQIWHDNGLHAAWLNRYYFFTRGFTVRVRRIKDLRRGCSTYAAASSTPNARKICGQARLH